MANSVNEGIFQYKKNKNATQGVTGQLYESKLNTLVLYRLLKNVKVKEFYMGSNLDGVGDMDDICIRLIHEDCEKPLLILIQAKHKDNPTNGILYEHLYQSKSDFYLPKNCNSLLKVKEKFAKIKNDIMFTGDFDELSHYFVFYTPAFSEMLNKKKEPEPSTNIDIVKDLLTSGDGKVYQIDYDEEDITKIKDGASTCDSIATEFFENVYFFTDQGKEDDVERELEKEIAEDRTPDGTLTHLQMKPTVSYLHFYNEVHKWWLSKGNVYYLMKTCNYFDSTLNDAVVDVFLNVLSYSCVNHFELYPIEFNMRSIDSAEVLLTGINNETNPIEAKITKIILTNSVLLTGIKLKQYFTSRDICSYYLSYSYVSKLTDGEFNILLNEIKKTIKHIIVIICDTQNVPNKRLEDINNACGRSIVIVVDESQNNDLGSLQGAVVKNDFNRGLVDISHDENILDYKITVQGVQTCLNKIIDDNSKKIINAEILLTILKNERIELGRSLFDYDSNKHWFDVREVTNETGTYIIDTINDNIGEVLPIEENQNESESGFNQMYDKVIVITAEPGMGKTTLLSRLSQIKKTCDLKTWIVRVDLQDYSEEFNKWKDNSTEVGLKETMLLICKAELEATDNDFDLVVTENRIDVVNSAIRGTSLLLLEHIVHCFNEGRILYLFDGFDRICPHHENEALKLIKNLTLSDMKELQVGSRVWITSRAYKIAMDALREFGEPFSLNSLSISQQKEFYTSYWQANISKKNLNINDSNKLKIWQNIRDFFNNMQNLRSARRHLEIMYETAWNYLQHEYNEDKDDEENITYRSSERETGLHLSGIPLYMELYAIKFTNHLTEYILTTDHKDASQNPEILWECDTYTFFKGLHDSEFEKVFYNGKNAFAPDARARCKAAKLKSNERHKLLAFFSLFNDDKDREYITELCIKLDVVFCDNIKNGKEKTGMIETIRQNIPKFIHQAFAECYAVEFITDLLKNIKNKRAATINLVINRLLDNNIGLMSAFEQKLKNDKELLKLLSEKHVKLYIFDTLMQQDVVNENSLHKVLVHGFKEIAKLLVQSIEVISDVDNIRHFVKFIKADFFIYAGSLNYKDLIEYVINKIKKVDSSMIEDIEKAITLEFNQNSLNITENMKKTIEKQLKIVNLYVR